MDMTLQWQMYYVYRNMSFDLWIEIWYTYWENDIEAKFYMENNMVMSRTIVRNRIDVKLLKW